MDVQRCCPGLRTYRTDDGIAARDRSPGVAESGNKLQDIVSNLGRTDDEFADALLFNRKLWAILLSAVTSDDNPQPVEVRQNIVNIGTFVLTQTAELQLNPQRDKLKPLIDINCNLAAGLSGRA